MTEEYTTNTTTDGIEILEGGNYTFSKPVMFVQKKVPVQTVIINGVEKNITADILSIVCPTCGKIIYTFQAGVSYIEAYKHILSIKNELQTGAGFCSTCGQKLDYNLDIVEVKA